MTTLYENMLFNNHNSKFNEVGEKSNIANHRALSTSAIFFDSDKDGWLDLYVGNYTEWSPDTDVWCTFQGKKGYCTPEVYDGVPSRFYRNNRDGTFTDQTLVAGFSSAPGKTLGVSELDFNKDGFPDLAVANDLARDLLYENNKELSMAFLFQLVNIQIFPKDRLDILIQFWDFAKKNNLEEIKNVLG